MGTVNFGFSPEFQRTLNALGIDFGKLRAGMATQLAAPSRGNYAPLSFDMNVAKNDPYYRLGHLGIATRGALLKSPEVQAAVQGKKQANISPDVQKLYDQVLKMRQVEATTGGPDTSPHKSFFHKLLDVISTPGRAVTTGGYALNQDVKNAEAQHKLFAGFRGFDQFAHGFAQGWKGQNSKTGVDILRDQVGIKNRAALLGGGLALDIASDPLSYVGFGVGKNLATKIPEAVAKESRTSTTAADIVKQIAAGPKLPSKLAGQVPTAVDLQKSLGGGIIKILTPTAKGAATREGTVQIGKISDMLGSQAGKSAQLSIADDLTKLGFDSKSALSSAKKWLNPKLATNPAVQSEKTLYGDLIKKLPGMQSSKHLDKTFTDIFKETKDNTEKQLTEILHANMEQQIKKTVNVRGLGFDVGVAPIPDVTIKAMSKAAQAPILNKVVAGYNKTFNTGSKLDHDLYVTKSRAAGKAEQRINLGQQAVVNAFQGIDKAHRMGYMNALVANPASFGRGVLTSKDGTDVGDTFREMMGHFGQYIDWTGKGSGVISLQKLNSYLPNKYKFETSVLSKQKHLFNPASSKGAQNFLNLIANQKDSFAHVDPQDFLYHMHIATEKAVARDQFMRGIADLGVPLKAGNLVTDPIQRDAIKTGASAVKKLVSEHGYLPINTKATRQIANDVDPSWARYLQNRVFHPDVHAGLLPMIKMMDDQKAVDGIGRFYDRALGYFKKAVTLPMPSYHLRNSFGDLLTSYTDNVAGARGLASYAQAAKVMRFINPVSKNDEVRKILEAPVQASGQIADPMQEISKLLQASGNRSVSGNLIMKKAPRWKDIPGKYVSAEQFMAAYQHMGLKRGFVASDLEHELKGNPNLLFKGMHSSMDQVLKLSQQREDYFRMAHFIDRIKRSKAGSFEEAAKEAAYYVKKFHFDYTDVTPTERAYFSRAIPFYKFQRFAAPLMMQMFFANPGKLLNAQKVLNSISYASGYSNDGGFLPNADAIMPEYMRDAAMIPLFSNKGNTAYFGSGLLPSTSIFTQTLGGEATTPGGIPKSIGQNIIQNTTPYAQIPAELYFGKRVFGKGQIPVQDSKGSYLPYFMSKTPVSNFGYNVGSGPSGGLDVSRILNLLSGLGISENTPARQKSELYREKDQITTNRKHRGYKSPSKLSNKVERNRTEPNNKEPGS